MLHVPSSFRTSVLVLRVLEAYPLRDFAIGPALGTD